MKVVLVALAVILGATWAKQAARSVHTGTVRTSKGDVKILSVYQDDSASEFTPKLGTTGIAPHVVGGDKVPHIREFPQVVSLLIYDIFWGSGRIVCSGTLVDKKIALTAAHCVVDPPAYESEVFLLCAGSVDLTSDAKFQVCSTVQNILVPEKYDDDHFWRGYDLAVLKLGASVLEKAIKRAKFSFAKPANLTPAYMVGFGQTRADRWTNGKMYYSDAQVVLNQNGRCKYLVETGDENDPDLICGRGVSDSVTCSGDSGGPLLVNTGGKPKNYIQVGVLSFGEVTCSTQWEGVYTSMYDRDHRKVFKFMVKDKFNGKILKGKL